MPTEVNIISGACHRDQRGELRYNNSFDSSAVKRMYLIRNSTDHPVRGWQGHQVEQRWFIAAGGSFKIHTIKIDDWEQPSVDVAARTFVLNEDQLDVLHVPAGHITAIEAIENRSALLVMSDYLLGAVKDEFRFPLSYFKHIF